VCIKDIEVEHERLLEHSMHSMDLESVRQRSATVDLGTRRELAELHTMLDLVEELKSYSYTFSMVAESTTMWRTREILPFITLKILIVSMFSSNSARIPDPFFGVVDSTA
jgi:hypothetical protein